MTPALVPALVLATGVVAYVLYPVVAGVEAPLEGSDDETTDAEHRKRAALTALGDVEHDFHAGKLDEEDYRAVKRRLLAEAGAAARDDAEERPAER